MNSDVFFKPLIKQASAYVASFLFGQSLAITSDTTIHDVAQSMAKNIELGQPAFSFPSPLLDQISLEELQKNSQATIIQQLEQSLLKGLEQPNQNPDTAKILDVIEIFLQQKVQNFLQPWFNYLPYLIALSVFFTVRFFSFVWFYGTIVITELLIWLFKSIGLIKIVSQKQPVERLYIT